MYATDIQNASLDSSICRELYRNELKTIAKEFKTYLDEQLQKQCSYSGITKIHNFQFYNKICEDIK